MSNRERGILIGLAVVLMVGTTFIIWRAREDAAGTGPTPPKAWDTSRLPALGTLLREWTTPGGVVVQSYTQGRGEPAAADKAMDIAYVGYSAVSGAIFERNTRPLVLAQGGVIPGWIEGLQGIRLGEKRRLLIPASMAYGDARVGNIAPNSDLVFDVEWVKLDIHDVKEGSGKEAKRGSRVLVHYKGTLEDGTVFDSSYQRGEPIWLTLQLRSVIDGWVYGIPGMRVGGVRNLRIPYHQAYGAQAKGKIPAYSPLLFVVELVDVE